MHIRYKIRTLVIGASYILGQLTLASAQLAPQNNVVTFEGNPFDQSSGFVSTQPAAPRSDLAEAASAIATIFGVVAGEKAAKAERRRQRELDARYATPMNVQQTVNVDNWGYTPPPVATPTCTAGDTAKIIGNQPYCLRTLTCKPSDKLLVANNVASCMQILDGGEELRDALSCGGGLRINGKVATCIMSPPKVS